jgi:hypothetical protein
VRFAYNWVAVACDPLRAIRAVRGVPQFVRDYRHYRHRRGAEPLRLLDTWPVLNEWAETHEVDRHYFYMNAWAMRRIMAISPRSHVDVASQTTLVGLLSAVVPVIYVDHRRLPVTLDKLRCVQASILELPLADSSVGSLSCLHVAEHVGLGRYGDPLDPDGTRKAAHELARVLMPGGSLFFALPVGRPRVCFNAHRIHAAGSIRQYFPGLDLIEYSGVHDDGRFVERVAFSEFDDSEYACGMFWFRRASA